MWEWVRPEVIVGGVEPTFRVFRFARWGAILTGRRGKKEVYIAGGDDRRRGIEESEIQAWAITLSVIS